MKDNSALEIAKELIKFNTENPPADTVEISRYIGELLEHKKIGYKLYKNKKSIYLLSEIGQGIKKIVLYGHSDIVTAGNIKNWASNPFSPIIKNGNLYGRGSSDMKGGLAAQISAFIELSEYSKKFNGKVQLLVCPEEEDFDSTKLLPKIIKASKPTACIMGEPHLDDIIIGEKGELTIKLRALGMASHGSTPASGIDANLMLDEFIHKLREKVDYFNQRITKSSSKLDNFFRESTIALSEEFALKQARKRNFIKSNPSGTITMNVGYYKSGNNVNIVPDEAEAHIEIMVPYGFDYKNITDFINKKVKSNKNLIISHIEGKNASITDKKDPIVSSLSEAYYKIKKKRPKLVFDTGCTDAVFYRAQKVPTVLYGPGYFHQAHTNNEFVCVKEIELSKQIYKKTVMNYLSLDG
jgi:succinyl-diaminopimelate desuccinylase